MLASTLRNCALTGLKRYPFTRPYSMSAPAIPQWLHDLHSHEHIVDVITTLSKRERARDAARARSRRKSSSSKTARVGGAVMDALSGSLPSDAKIDHYSVSVGSLPENKAGNRYLMLEPYDRTRVVVGEGRSGELSQGHEGVNEGRYINANWVRELAGGKWWIATQAPLPNTVHAFLSVILQPISRPPHQLHPRQYSSETTRVRTVVQLTPNIEKGLRKGVLFYHRMRYTY
jgi:protein-tyrosine phosphatase